MAKKVFHSRLFWKLYLSYSGLVLVVAALVAMLQLHFVEKNLNALITKASATGILDSSFQEAWLQEWHQTQLYLSETLIAGIVISLLLAYVMARRTTRPLAQMLQVSESMLEGRYNQRVLSLPTDEMGQLGRTLNRLSTEITSKIETISLERAQLNTIMSNMIEGIICVDQFGSIQFCNQAAYQLFAVTKSDVRSMNIRDVLGFSILAELVEEARQKHEAVSSEIRLQRGEQEKKSFLQVRASPFDSDASSGVIVVAHDVTKMRRLEKMRRDFVANVSHEIKTPLTAIRGYVETLLNDGLEHSPLVKRFLEKVDANAKRLNILVLDILSLARIEDDEERLATVPVSWDGMLLQVVSSYEDLCSEKRLQVNTRIEQPGLLALGDREAMLQVLDNLFSNAIRYTPTGGLIDLSVWRDGDSVILSVRDTGIGIQKKYQTRIFERFYRVDKARSRELGGTGLGLAIVKHLVLSMAGRIDVESEVEQGSTFRVALRSAEANRSTILVGDAVIPVERRSIAATEIHSPILS